MSDARGTDVVRVDATVTGPTGQVLYAQTGKTHAEVNIKPTMHGEYSLCLRHHGTPSEKTVDYDVNLPSKREEKKLDLAVDKLQHELGELIHLMKYIKNREKRNLDTVSSIESWVFYVSFFEVLLVMGMSLLVHVILRAFFSGNRQRI